MLARPCQATAVVYHELLPQWTSFAPAPGAAHPSASQGANSALPKSLVEAVREMVFSPRALENAGQVREGVDVQVKRIANPDGLRVAICCENTSPERAARAADLLAKSYAAQVRSAWHEQAQRHCDAAQLAAGQARDELLKAQSRLDLFLQARADGQARGDVGQQSAATPEPEAALAVGPERPAREAPQPAAAPLPQIQRGQAQGQAAGERRIENNQSGGIENPRWVELNEHVEQLRKRLAESLETRTALHPLVQKIEDDLREAEARLAAEPQWLPDAQAGQREPSAARQSRALRVANPYFSADGLQSSLPTAPACAPQETAAVADSAMKPPSLGTDGPTLAELRHQFEQAAIAFDRAADRQRDAWEAALREPRIETEPARIAALPALLPIWRLAFAAALVGLMAAGGVELIAAAARIQPVLRTAAEAEAAVGAPLAGCVTASELGLEPDAWQLAAQPDWARPVLMLAGMGLLAAGLAGAWVWMG